MDVVLHWTWWFSFQEGVVEAAGAAAMGGFSTTAGVGRSGERAEGGARGVMIGRTGRSNGGHRVIDQLGHLLPGSERMSARGRRVLRRHRRYGRDPLAATGFPWDGRELIMSERRKSRRRRRGRRLCRPAGPILVDDDDT
jgi:hypothetical protein